MARTHNNGVCLLTGGPVAPQSRRGGPPKTYGFGGRTAPSPGPGGPDSPYTRKKKDENGGILRALKKFLKRPEIRVNSLEQLERFWQFAAPP